MPRITTKTTSIAYHSRQGEGAHVLFLGGFKSNMLGSKALALQSAADVRNWPFTRFDYGGHGESSGAFEEGSIGAWFTDALAVFDQATRGKTILVGSSMGGWMMLLLALARPERVAGLLGIAAAPDFTQYLIWDAFTAEQRQEMAENGRVIIKNCTPGEEDYPNTQYLIEEGRKHLLLHKESPISCPVHLIHGMRDADVPYQVSLDLAAKLAREDTRITLIKNGDHRLSEPEQLDFIIESVEDLRKKEAS